MAALEEGRAADVLEELSPEDQVDVLEDLPRERAADILEEMGPDEAADLIADLPEERQQELLGLMEPAEADDVRELLCLRRGDGGRTDDDRLPHRLGR